MTLRLPLILGVVFLSTNAFAQGSGVSEGPVASAACNELCAGVGDSAEGASSEEERLKFAACFSCRCKESIGWMPDPADLKCSAGTHLERYRARTEPHGDGGKPRVVGLDVIDPEGSDKDGCLNGGIAAAGCDLKSRFRRLTHEGAEYQVLCRKPWSTDNGYYEYLIIGNNSRSGATCFWQARDYHFDGENVPSLDVTDASHRPDPEAARRYAETFFLYSAGPSTCTACHASDAFIWSPYLHSAFPVPLQDPLTRARLRAPYYKVSAASERLQPVGHRFLKGGPATPARDAPSTSLSCAGCHRIADGSFCYSMSWQALGLSDRAGTQDLDQQTAFEHARRLLFWMPPTGDSHTTWYNRASADLSRIRECCVNGGHPACNWSDAW